MINFLLSKIIYKTNQKRFKEFKMNTPTQKDTLLQLLEGNTRFINETSEKPIKNMKRVFEIAPAQYPKVVIIACSDSRYPLTTIFDQEPGVIHPANQEKPLATVAAYLLHIPDLHTHPK